jgi:hypothetical protein
MNYLLFVYYNTDVTNSEEKTQEIGGHISDVMTSKEIKFMYGDLHSIFNFSANLSFDEMNNFMEIVVIDVQQFEYILIPKPRNFGSNFDEDNLKHLLSLKKKSKQKLKPVTPKLRTNDISCGENFMDIADIILGFKTPEVCNLTLDDLLDKICNEGMESLSELERLKLEEYSKSL